MQVCAAVCVTLLTHDVLVQDQAYEELPLMCCSPDETTFMPGGRPHV
jgi:hypothetical protein